MGALYANHIANTAKDIANTAATVAASFHFFRPPEILSGSSSFLLARSVLYFLMRLTVFCLPSAVFVGVDYFCHERVPHHVGGVKTEMRYPRDIPQNFDCFAQP